MKGHKISKLICTLGIVGFLSGCYIPGNYFDNSTADKGYRVGDQTVYPNITQLDANWVAQNLETKPYKYYVGPFDVLNVIVWDHPELTTPSTQLSSPEESGLLVNSDGYIFFPFGGEIKVSGQTTDEIRRLVTEKIAKYINDPQVSIRIISFRFQEVQVVGATGGARTIPISDKPLTLMDAINQAGGVDKIGANTTHIFVVRGTLENLQIFWINTQTPANLMAAQRFVLENNDIVYVPPSGLSNWNKVISQLLPFVSAKSTVDDELD